MTSNVKSLLKFLDNSPMSFQAVATVAATLSEAGFTRLDPADEWVIEPGGRYYVIKNDSAIFAFIAGEGDPAVDGFRIISAHSDSPGFRIKPHAAMLAPGNVVKLNTEVYGGPILYTWFDHPLSVAGRVMTRGADALHPVTRLVKVDRPLLTIPHLAIHFNRQVNEGNPISKQKDMLPVLGIVKDRLEADNLLMEALDLDPAEIIGMELGLYDTTPAMTVGANDEFISSGRIDDLSMVHAAMTALLAEADKPCRATRVMAIFDNEETGSGTKQGAASPVLDGIMRRVVDLLAPSRRQAYYRAIASSFMVSADNAHAVHPNYVEKQDPTNHPVLGGGPVIKINANCKYMTDADSAAVFARVCSDAGVPVQYFVNRSDIAGGSTLGNILTSQIDLRGVDMGAAMWAMHSCRETASAADHDMITHAFAAFYTL
ncbi:MAG: M18 family aminopeptidase [Muribaculaceae bacterium]|nr:M18 family aminopeptidase [Muribaculaceae bacterium]